MRRVLKGNHFQIIIRQGKREALKPKGPLVEFLKGTLLWGITISICNSFDLFSYGLESVFWYFQFQWLISDFSDNPLKLHKISCRGPQIRDICLPFSKKKNFVRFGVNGASFLQDIQRKKSKKKW